jgi:pyruvate-formate lyase-activating enzyme
MIDNFSIIEPAIDPANRITFLLDWELTMKCNLDCHYCESHLYGGHDNTTKHPPLDECIKTIDFMYQYVDIYMSKKPKGIKHVVLNLYGGEALHYPSILEILETCKKKYDESYQDKWNLVITTTTNAIIPEKKFSSIISYIDEFSCSYHSQNTDRQKQQFKNNLLQIRDRGKRVKCIVLMHTEPELFQDSKNMIQWCIDNDIKYLPRQLDSLAGAHTYNEQQIIWFDTLYKNKSHRSLQQTSLTESTKNQSFALSDLGRACCGGRQLCADKNYKSKEFYVQNKFPDWFCSVNEFFVYIKQITKEIFVNKDCKMNFAGSVGPIGNLDQSDRLIDWTKQHFGTDRMPTIQCKKQICLCGLCAPKAKSLNDFDKIMEKYRKCDIS